MAHMQALPGLAVLGWTRIQGAALPRLLVKTGGVLAASLALLRLMALG